MKSPAIRIGLTAVALFCLAACVSASPAGPVWPAAPAAARIEYVGSISTPSDAGIKESSWRRFGHWLTGEGHEASALDKPFGLAVDDAGNLLVTDTGARIVCWFDFAGKKLHCWNGAGKVAFQSPVAVAKRGGILFVADSGLGEVMAISEQGRLLFELKDHLSRPVGLALSSNVLCVADATLHHVAIFDLNGRFQSEFGQRGSNPGEFNFPTHLAVNRAGEVLVTDSMNQRVEVFDAKGKYLRTIGGPGESSGHFTRPKGVAVDAQGNIYVVDALFDNIQIFDDKGEFLLDVGTSGGGPGQFWLPAGIAITKKNIIYVADSSNHRVQILKYLEQP